MYVMFFRIFYWRISTVASLSFPSLYFLKFSQSDTKRKYLLIWRQCIKNVWTPLSFLHFLIMLLFELNYFVLSYSERKNHKLERRLQHASYSLLFLTLATPPASYNGSTTEKCEPHTQSSVVLPSSMGQILSITSVQTQKQLLVHVISTSGSIYPEFSF